MEPFCFAGPALLAPPGSRATSAAAATTAAPGLARQSRSGAGAQGWPGGGRGRGPSGPGISSARPRSRGHHFLLACRRRRRREPGLPASPSRAALFGWGEPKRKSFAGGAGEGAPRAAGTRRGAATAVPPRSPLPPRPPRRRTDPRGRGEAPFFLSLPLCPALRGKLGRGGREAPRRSCLPAAHAASWCSEAAGPGARRGHRRPRRDTHAHTHPPWLAVGRGGWSRTLSVRVRASVWGGPPCRPRVLFPEAAPSSSWLQGTPCLVFYRGKEEFFVEIPARSASLRWRLLAVAYVVMPGSLALSRVNRSFWIFSHLFSLKIGDQVKFLESQM